MKDLKPCPFCGKSEHEDAQLQPFTPEHYVRCQNCGAYGPWADTIKGARELWNKRIKEGSDV